ncbi:hypothetical protein C0993_007007, partial [Termitomyces sp. T159_Od127]
SQQAQAAATTQATTTTVQHSVAPTAPAASSTINTREISKLNDTLSSVGVDLWHKIAKILDDVTNYLILVLHACLQDLVAAMITTSHHCTDTQFNHSAMLYPNASLMWSIVIHSNIAKQLATLKKDMATAQANGGIALYMDGYNNLKGGMKKKRKKEGLGIMAQNMLEDVRKKMSNAVAMQAVGLGGQYAWMNVSNAAAAAMLIKPKIAAPPMVSAASAAATATLPNASGTTMTLPVSTTMPMASLVTSSWARPYVSTKKSTTPTAAPEEDNTQTLVTMQDAMFVIEKEHGHGGGKGTVHGWS